MNSLMEALVVFAIPIVSSALFIGGYVYWTLLRQRRAQRRAALSPAVTFHGNEWDFTVDGKVMATLIPTGPPEDPNNQFIIFEVRIAAGHDADIDQLLFNSNKRAPDDARICYRSSNGGGVILKDSQVYVGQCGKHLVRMKAYPSEEQIVQAVEFLTDHPAPPQSPETPSPRAE
ncbi:MAG: hypothetical protein NTY98_23940 [Verrucomicrobia bacterium]|nr:hypothetical protein [Verrucomicrobiota bacterium]